jgi:hypothetical protein
VWPHHFQKAKPRAKTREGVNRLLFCWKGLAVKVQDRLLDASKRLFLVVERGELKEKGDSENIGGEVGVASEFGS